MNVRKVLVSVVRRYSSPGLNEKPIATIPSYIHEFLFRSAAPSSSTQYEHKLILPPLQGDNLRDHFNNLAENHIGKYFNLLDEGMECFSKEIVLPKEWEFVEGWMRYPLDGGPPEKVPYPLEDVLVFDVETCVSKGQLPTLAICLSPTAIYGWCSEFLIRESDYPTNAKIEHLIPLGGHDHPRIAIGHNVGYDRVRSQEPYFREKTFLRFMDTMSMWIPISGMADHQRSLYEADDLVIAEMDENLAWRDSWKQKVSKNSLADVYSHFFNEELSKENQKYFVTASISDIRTSFQELMTYCAMDCVATGKVYAKLWPKFKERFPSLITLYGFLNVGNAYLPINRHWNEFFKVNEISCEEKKLQAAQAIASSAKSLIESTDAKLAVDDPWMWAYDWSLDKKGKYPAWFYKLFRKRVFADSEITNLISEDVVTKSAMIPGIFGMIYGPYPVYKSKTKGWGYLVPTTKKANKKKTADEELLIPIENIKKCVNENMDKYGEIPLTNDPSLHFGEIDFYKFPHPSGSGNVGDILSKLFAAELDEKVLRASRYEEEFEKVLLSLRSTRFWTSYRERYHSEVPIWYEDGGESDNMIGAIAPAIVPAGTVSRRSVHKLWVTLTNSASDKNFGTGIKSMIQAPPGYRLVGADVDSQEQWLAGLFGDASAAKCLPLEERKAGVTPFSKMMLVGTKNDGTDLHTVVAKQLGINRNSAKILNYARLYGSGQRHAELSLVQSGVPPNDAKKISRDLFALTKGTISFWRRLQSSLVPLLDQFKHDGGTVTTLGFDGNFYLPSYSNMFKDGVIKFEDWLLTKLNEGGVMYNPEDVLPLIYENFGKEYSLYYGGYESATFNFLEEETRKKLLRTPVLDCQLGDSLAQLSEDVPDRYAFNAKYKRSVMNWLVQSSAVDFLHLLLLCMEGFCSTYDIKCRFVISIHDEIRYLCPNEEAARVGLALMLSNLYVRAFITEKVGISQLPMTVAFFSQVDCDVVLRKEVDSHFSNPDGSTVEDGIAWTIDDLMKLTKGTLKMK